MTAFGLDAADYESDNSTRLWDCNQLSFSLFCAMATQWKAGFSGIYALDYASLIAIMDIWQIAQNERAALFADVQACERAALACINRK